MTLFNSEPDQHQTKTISVDRIKPLIGYTAKLNCNTFLSMTCLSRDRPKSLAKISIRLGIESKIGNKGMRQLCQALKNSKGNKELMLNIQMCNHKQLWILAQWLRTCKFLKKLELRFKWNRRNSGLAEFLSNLKDVKGLEELDLEIQREFLREQSPNCGPDIKWRYLKGLRKLKISRGENDSSQENNMRKLFKGLKGLGKLSGLHLDFSFCKGQSKEEIEENFLEPLRGMRNLQYLTLDLSENSSIEDKTLDQLFSWICGLENLVSLDLISGVCSSKIPESLKRLQENLENKSSFKNLSLVGRKKCPSDLLIEGLYMKKNQSLKLLGVDFSERALDTDPLFMERVDISLRNTPSLQSLELFLPPRTLGIETYKDLGLGLQALSGSLKSLTLSLAKSFELSIEKIGYVAEGIKALKTLSSLYLKLSHCEISIEGMRLIAESIDGLENLRELTLNLGSPVRKPQNQGFLSLFKKKVRETGLEYFGPVFQRHKKLSYLALLLYGLRPSLEEFEALASGIEGLKTLHCFVLWSDDTRKRDELFFGYRSLYKSLKNLPALNSLALKYETVNSEDLESLFLHLGGLTNLVTLNLEFVQGESMSYEAADSFVEAMKNLRFLRNLTLRILWKGNIKEEIVDRWNDGLREIEYLTTFVWAFGGLRRREQAIKLFQRTKYIKVYSTFVRYRCISHFPVIPT